MVRRPALSSLCAAFLLLVALVFAAEPSNGTENAKDTALPENADTIARCVAKGEEAVLLPTGVQCAAYGQGGALVKTPEMPQRVDELKLCQDASDRRVLPKDAIKRIAGSDTGQYVARRIDPTGIRIIGAIFCEQLDLIGLDLPYSLVIDNSMFAKGIEGRNFRTSGDFSVDDALIFGELRIARSYVGGTVFGSGTYIQKAQILDSEVRGSVLFRKTVLLEPAIFDTVTVSGELSLRQSALPYFLLQYSKVGGVLDLTRSRARCAYQLRVDEIGDLVAVDAGLGFMSGQTKEKLSPFFVAARIPEDRSCGYPLIASPNVFVVSDSTVKARLCLRSFHWPSASDANSESDLTFNDVAVGGTAFIDLIESAGSAAVATDSAAKRRFGLLGFQTNSLVINFGTPRQSQSYTSSYVNGLKARGLRGRGSMQLQS
jgi:hypothetical protein